MAIGDIKYVIIVGLVIILEVSPFILGIPHIIYYDREKLFDCKILSTEIVYGYSTSEIRSDVEEIELEKVHKLRHFCPKYNCSVIAEVELLPVNRTRLCAFRNPPFYEPNKPNVTVAPLHLSRWYDYLIIVYSIICWVIVSLPSVLVLCGGACFCLCGNNDDDNVRSGKPA